MLIKIKNICVTAVIYMETEALCSLLLDGEFLFSTTVETMALKMQKTTEIVFKKNPEVPKTALQEPVFVGGRTHILKNLRWSSNFDRKEVSQSCSS